MKIYLFIILIGFFVGCSGGYDINKQSSDKSVSVDLDVNSIYAWVDYMPGGKFNGNLRLSGDLIIKKSKDYDFTQLNLFKISVYQNEALFYKITPQIMDNINYKKSDRKNIIFSTIERLEIIEGFDLNKNINIELLFKDSEKNYSIIVKNIKIEETY